MNMKREKLNEYYSIHDHEVKSYTVDIGRHAICLNTDYCGKESAVIRFEGLLGHRFEYVLHWQNVILCIIEISAASFIEEEKEFLGIASQYAFPAGLRRVSELQSYLEQNGYRVFCIDSAIGLSGFVIAKDISITISPVVLDKEKDAHDA